MTKNDQFIIFIFVLIICLQYVDTQTCNDFQQFKTLCNRIYSLDEEGLRKKIYEARCNQINQFNQLQNETYQKILNCFTGDRLENEPPSLLPLKTSAIKSEVFVSEPGAVSAPTLPSSYNMATLGYVSSVQNQGRCGSCWSFAATGLYEAYLRLRGYSYGLSDQGPLQCTNNYSTKKRVSDCSGGYFEDALYYYARVGGILRSNWPYYSGSYGSSSGFYISKGICNEVNRIYIGRGTVKLYGGLPNSQIKSLLINKGPFVAGIYVNQAFIDYKRLIFTGCPADAAYYINHAVLLVGYDDSTNSWLAKNQWGAGWGEDGYIRISYSRDCGLSNLVGNIQFGELSANPEVSFANNSALITQDYLAEPYIRHFMAFGFLLLVFYLF